MNRFNKIDGRVFALTYGGGVEPSHQGVFSQQSGVRASDNDGKARALFLYAVEHQTCPVEEHGARAYTNKVGVSQGFIEAFDGVHRQVEKFNRIAVSLEHGADMQKPKRLLKLPESRIIPIEGKPILCSSFLI